MKKIFVFSSILLITACSGSRPVQLGDVNTELWPCPDKPNCVSSLADQNDEHHIAPIKLNDESQGLQPIVSIIKTTERAEVIFESEEYVYAEYTSKVMGFVDDVEFLLSPDRDIVHVRSASRLGYRDFDVNRERVEAIRAELSAQ